MQTEYRLEVVTPERVIYEGNVTSLTLPSSEGLLGILPNHAPLVTAVDVGQVTIKDASGQEDFLMVADGFFEVADNHARILADAGERSEDIDMDRAHEAEERARERLKHRGERDYDLDTDRAERSLQRSLWRQIIARRRGR